MNFFNPGFKISFILVFFLQINPLQAEDTPCADLFDDWVCTKEGECNNLCNGNYLEPPVAFPGQSAELLASQPITITADTGTFANEGNTTLIGKVQVNQGNRVVLADKAIIHRDPLKSEIDNIKGLGNVRLTEPGIRIQGSFAELKMEEDTQYLEHACYRLYPRHARGEASSVLITDRSKMLLTDASYTTCAPGQNTWVLKANRIKMNRITGRGKSYHTRLYYKDFPIFYSPYWDFPIDDRRQTGFLLPTYDRTKNSGVIFSAPIYWNIAPNYDATLTPRYFSKRGAALDGLFRYLIPNSVGEINASILPKDKAYHKFQERYLLNHVPLLNNDPRVTGLHTSDTRRALRILNRTTFNPNLGFNLQYSAVSDDNYLADFSNTLGAGSTTQLLQQGDLGYQDRYWNGLLRVQRYQTLHPYFGPQVNPVYQKLPQLAFKNELPDLDCGIEITTMGDFTHFAHRKNYLNNMQLTTNYLRPTVGNRFQVRPAVAAPIISPGWYVKPRLQIDFLGYNVEVGKVDQNISLPKNVSRIIPMLDIDSGLIFERDISLNEIAYIQTLEPRAYYLFVPYHDQNNLPNFDTANMGFDFNQLYRDNRFNGLDRIGDANQITLGLTTRFLEELNGQERLMLSVGQIYYFKNRVVTAINPAFLAPQLPDTQDAKRIRKQRVSPLAAQGVYHLQAAWTVTAGQQWDPYKTSANQSLLGIQYHPEPLNVINLRYIFVNKNFARIDRLTGRPERLNQSDLSTAWGLSEQWRILGRWRYDIYKKHSAEQLIGIEHQGCCTAVRLTMNRFLQLNDTTIPSDKRYETGIFLQFVFKGLGGVGHNRMGSVLKDAIPGYEWRGENF